MPLLTLALAILCAAPGIADVAGFRFASVLGDETAFRGEEYSSAGNAISTVVVVEGAIIITVPIEVLDGSEALIERWQQGIDESWNRGNNGGPFRVCGRAVEFNASFTLRQPPNTLTRAAHVVVVETVKPGQTYISRVWHALGSSPLSSARTGFWGSDMDGATAAHEFGHLLGLLDEYIEADKGMRAPGERPVPDEARFPDAWLSLMAQEHGSVLERHVREILRVHDAQDALSCAP